MKRTLSILFLLLTIVAVASVTLAFGAASGPLKYTLGYKGYPSPGATILLIHNFTADWNTYDIMVNSFTVTTKWGFLNMTGYGLPFTIGWPGSRLVNTSLQIPASTAFGSYPVNVWVNWDYRTIFTGWLSGQDLVVNATLQVSPKPPFTIPITIRKLPSWTFSGVLFYLGAASLLTVLVAGREENRRHNRLEILRLNRQK